MESIRSALGITSQQPSTTIGSNPMAPSVRKHMASPGQPGCSFRQAGDHPMVSLAQQDSIAHGFPAVGFPHLCLICWKVNWTPSTPGPTKEKHGPEFCGCHGLLPTSTPCLPASKWLKSRQSLMISGTSMLQQGAKNKPGWSCSDHRKKSSTSRSISKHEWLDQKPPGCWLHSLIISCSFHVPKPFGSKTRSQTCPEIVPLQTSHGLIFQDLFVPTADANIHLCAVIIHNDLPGKAGLAWGPCWCRLNGLPTAGLGNYKLEMYPQTCQGVYEKRLWDCQFRWKQM